MFDVPEATRETVLAKCDFFVESQVWSPHTRIDPTGWLDNFRNNEEPYALQLLNSVSFFNEILTDRLFASAFHAISNELGCPRLSSIKARSVWRDFLSSVVITPVTGEDPRPTDSGNLFARKARDVLRLDENRILTNNDALQAIVDGRATNIAFVDDFVGTGQQFYDTWHREHDINGVRLSFHTASVSRKTTFFYCPLFCTTYALNNDIGLRDLRSLVRIRPVHLLTDADNALSPHSRIWPTHLRADAFSIIREASMRAGLPETNGTSTTDWTGYRSLGLTIAFSHGVPDATLPLFTTDLNGWKPLFPKP